MPYSQQPSYPIRVIQLQGRVRRGRSGEECLSQGLAGGLHEVVVAESASGKCLTVLIKALPVAMSSERGTVLVRVCSGAARRVQLER